MLSILSYTLLPSGVRLRNYVALIMHTCRPENQIFATWRTNPIQIEMLEVIHINI